MLSEFWIKSVFNTKMKEILVRIILSVLVSAMLFLVFSMNDGLVAFVVILVILQIIDLLFILIRKKIVIFLISLLWHIILIGSYYFLIENGLRVT